MARKSMVVGVDGSAEARRALEVAARLAERVRAQLVPVYSVPDMWIAGGLNDTPVVQPEVYELLVQDAREQVERFLHDALPGVKATLEVRTGVAAVAIAEVARERGAELVVLGGKHHTALARGLGQSTAHYLVRALDVPLLVVGGSAKPIAHILASVDLSEASNPVLEAARQWAKTLGAHVRAIHVVEPLHLFYLPVAPVDQQGYDERSRVAFDALMKRSRMPGTDHLLRTGIAPDVLATEATSWPADLVVVGSHGKNWVDRLLVGSTTERLLNALPSSILVIPTARAKVVRRRPSRRQAAKRPASKRR
ncbi:MAG TPA: universal stress protein [Gemmatimonadales bacterium]|nr:universal stress protein [Gemmatimonadales bacterium]